MAKRLCRGHIVGIGGPKCDLSLRDRINHGPVASGHELYAHHIKPKQKGSILVFTKYRTQDAEM